MLPRILLRHRPRPPPPHPPLHLPLLLCHLLRRKTQSQRAVCRLVWQAVVVALLALWSLIDLLLILVVSFSFDLDLILLNLFLFPILDVNRRKRCVMYDDEKEFPSPASLEMRIFLKLDSL